MIIKADSELIINSVKIICCGTKSEKVSRFWRLLQVFQRIQIHLLCLQIMSFTHVRRLANKLADILANQGVLCTKIRVNLSWQEMPQNRLREYCLNQANADRTLFRNIVTETESSCFSFNTKCYFRSDVTIGM